MLSLCDIGGFGRYHMSLSFIVFVTSESLGSLELEKTFKTWSERITHHVVIKWIQPMDPPIPCVT